MIAFGRRHIVRRCALPAAFWLNRLRFFSGCRFLQFMADADGFQRYATLSGACRIFGHAALERPEVSLFMEELNACAAVHGLGRLDHPAANLHLTCAGPTSRAWNALERPFEAGQPPFASS